MRTETSIDGVREQTKLLLHAVPIRCDKDFEFVVHHPFTQSPWVAVSGHETVDLRTEDGHQKWIQLTEEAIDKMDSHSIFHILIVNTWNLTWLKYVKPFLSLEDFSKLLRDAWIDEENPNMDNNVSTTTAIKWFKEADKRSLMKEDDYTYWESLPEEIVLYRGVSNGRKKYGLSWTDSKETAIWFQSRFATGKKKGLLLRVKVNKKHCLCYLNSRGEKEIILDVNAVKKDIEDITKETI